MAILSPDLVILESCPRKDYSLLDSGDGRKFEAYGPYSFVRPDAQALWRPRLAEWKADAEFVPASDEDGGGRWQFANKVPREGWPLQWQDVRFTAQCTPFRHLGFFPDMAPVWRWMTQLLEPLEKPVAMNLFGYTGLATLALAAEGVSVTHVDASKKSVTAARANAQLSGLADRPVRWITDDAMKFTAREGRRGRRYDGIILDPPKYGRGPEGEVWKLEADLPLLIDHCRALLDKQSRFLFLTVYAVRMSSLALGALLEEAFGDLPGRIEMGELAVREEPQGQVPGRLLPTAIFARWRND